MVAPIVFTKSLGTAHATGIGTSQSVAAGGSMVLNGSLTNYLSTTSSAAAAVGAVVIPMTSTTGVTVGESVADTTATALVASSVVKAFSSTSVTIWPPIGGTVGVGSGDTIVFGGASGGTAILDTATSTNSAIGRRVVVAYTGTDGNWTVTGTNSTGNVITDTFSGSGGAGQSNLDFVTVTSIVSANSVTGATAGTNGVGSSPWITLNWQMPAMQTGFAVELVSGAVNFTIQHSYDDPNNLLGGLTYPLPYNDPVVNGVSVTAEGSYLTPISCIRLLINSGTGVARVRVEQSGIG